MVPNVFKWLLIVTFDQARQMVHYATSARGILGFTDRSRAAVTARGLERAERVEARGRSPRPEGGRKTQEPEGGGGVIT
jgi:hypothetical protein